MKVTGKIEAIGTLSSGFSNYTGEPWVACSVVVQCTEKIGENEVKNSILLRARGQVCEALQKLNKLADVAGNIDGIYSFTYYSSVKNVKTKDGKEFEKLELNLINFERVDYE